MIELSHNLPCVKRSLLTSKSGPIFLQVCFALTIRLWQNENEETSTNIGIDYTGVSFIELSTVIPDQTKYGMVEIWHLKLKQSRNMTKLKSHKIEILFTITSNTRKTERNSKRELSYNLPCVKGYLSCYTNLSKKKNWTKFPASLFGCYYSVFGLIKIKRKRKRSDPVLWQKPPYNQKKKAKRQKIDATKNSIAQGFRTDSVRSVVVTNVIQVINRLTGSQPSHSPQQLCNRGYEHACNVWH